MYCPIFSVKAVKTMQRGFHYFTQKEFGVREIAKYIETPLLLKLDDLTSIPRTRVNVESMNQQPKSVMEPLKAHCGMYAPLDLPSSFFLSFTHMHIQHAYY